MLPDFFQRLSARLEDDKPLSRDQTRTAVAALLVIAARADQSYTEIERGQIERVLADRYGLNAEAAATARADGEAAEEASMDMYKFTALIKSHIELEERVSIIEAMWRVVLADNVREQHEDTLMRRVTDLLGLDTRDSVEARRRAQAKI